MIWRLCLALIFCISAAAQQSPDSIMASAERAKSDAEQAKTEGLVKGGLTVAAGVAAFAKGMGMVGSGTGHLAVAQTYSSIAKTNIATGNQLIFDGINMISTCGATAGATCAAGEAVVAQGSNIQQAGFAQEEQAVIESQLGNSLITKGHWMEGIGTALALAGASAINEANNISDTNGMLNNMCGNITVDGKSNCSINTDNQNANLQQPPQNLPANLPNDIPLSLSSISLPKNYKLDTNKKTITTPNGKVINFTGMTPSKAASVVGLSGKDLRLFNGILAATKKKTEEVMGEKSVAGNEGKSGGDGFYEGGSGANGSARRTESDADLLAKIGMKTQGGLRRATAAEEAIGLSTRYNGEPIGVANDDIFKMINRRYQAKGALLVDVSK